MTFKTVRFALQNARGISWDGCHKIYILMDDESLVDQYACGYGTDGGTFCTETTNPDDDLHTIKSWWEDSCGLRFVTAVSNGGNKLEDFYRLIEQFEDAY